jgi:hypothetical protein
MDYIRADRAGPFPLPFSSTPPSNPSRCSSHHRRQCSLSRSPTFSMISSNTSLASSRCSSPLESRIAPDTAFRASGNTIRGNADNVDTRTRRSRCRRSAVSSSAAERSANTERREDRQNWPIAGAFPLALFVSALYARRSCAVVSLPSSEFCMCHTFSVSELRKTNRACHDTPRGDSVCRTERSSPQRLAVAHLPLEPQLPQSNPAGQRILPGSPNVRTRKSPGAMGHLDALLNDSE